MSPVALEELKAQIRGLPTQDRAELVQFLLDSLEPEVDVDAEAMWEVELARRVADIRAGRVTGKPANQVFAKLRA